MITRRGVLLVAAACFAGLLGCVSADVYRVKEQEVQTLLRTNEEMQGQNRSLFAEKTELEIRTAAMKKENEGLQDRIEKQKKEIVSLKSLAEKLEKEGEGLRGRAEKLNDKIAELNRENQRLATLSRPENLLRSLGERLAELQKQVEALAGENETLKSKQVIARSQGEVTGGAEQENTIKSQDERLQVIPVSTVQKEEESKPGRRLQDEREAPVGDREKPADKP